MNDMDIAAHFVPKEDITAYELALCLPYTRGCIGGWQVGLIPDQVRRHFACAYRPENAEAASIAQRFGVKNKIQLAECEDRE